MTRKDRELTRKMKNQEIKNQAERTRNGITKSQGYNKKIQKEQRHTEE